MKNKKCSGCKVLKNTSEFFKSASRSDGLQAYCKVCSKAQRKKYIDKNKDREKRYSREKNLKNKYGITNEQYEAQHKAQKGVCPLCQKPAFGVGSSGVVDHDHTTGKVRGVLCHLCNSALHAIERDRSWAKRAVEYLDAGGIWED